MTDTRARLHLIITGRVQGVFFRWSSAEEARLLGLSGWARNRADGSVELVAEGARQSLEILLGWAHRGPRHARVHGVQIEWQQYRDEFSGFEVR